MRQIFISDLHLDDSHDELRAGFFRFLDEIRGNTDQLYILGDFFEAWLGDDDDTTFNRSIIEALATLPADIFVMHGNRDFLLGDKFCRAAGATLLPDPTTITTAVGPALLLHGDSLCTRDTAYMEARTLLRSSAFQADFLSKSLPERQAFANRLRGESKAHTRETAADIMDVTQSEVELALQTAGVSVMIHGHTHRPAVHEFTLPGGAAVRYVLGDWHSTMQYLAIDESGADLITYTL
jgi:UDP-2,3-diacylglucosamine hydrolase